MTKIRCLLILFLLISTGSIVQSISGRVVNIYSGEGVGNAVLRSGNFEAFTDMEGHFIVQVKDFPVEVMIYAKGYLPEKLILQKPVQEKIIELTPVSESLSEVVVRSSLIPKSLQQTPAAVGIIDKTEMQRTGASNFVGVLNSVPGVYLHQGALNTNKLSIRGVGARSQYSTNRIKAYFEGIPISTAEGETTLDDLDMSVIERVEIIKGPNSSIYGAGLGGVINLHAGTGARKGTVGRAEVGFGSFGLFQTGISVSHNTESADLFAAYNKLQTDSFRENGAYDRESFSVFGKIMENSSGHLSLFANFTELFAYIPSSVSREQMEQDPSSAAFTWNAAQGYESYNKGLLGVAYEQQLWEELQNTTSVYINFRDAYEPRPFDILKEDQMAVGARTKFNMKAEVFGLSSEFSLGAEFNQEWYDSATFENLYEDFPGRGSVRGEHLSDNSQLRRYYNLFGQWDLSLSEALTVEAGLNINGTSYDLTDLFAGDEIDQTGDYSFNTIYSPRIGAVYELTLAKSLYASISHGFSTPSVAQTLTPEGLINTELKPETGINYEVGFKGNWLENRLYSELALYSIQVSDLLVAERVAEDQYIGRNAGKTDHNGIEILLRSNIMISEDLYLKPFFNAAINFFQFQEFVDQGMDHSGNELPGVPEKTINAGLDLVSASGFSLYASYFHSGEIPLNDANTAYSESYDLIDLKAAYKRMFWEKLELELSVGVNNLFDENYASSVIPNAVGFGGAAPRYFYPGNPRNYYGGVELNFRL